MMMMMMMKTTAMMEKSERKNQQLKKNSITEVKNVPLQKQQLFLHKFDQAAPRSPVGLSTVEWIHYAAPASVTLRWFRPFTDQRTLLTR